MTNGLLILSASDVKRLVSMRDIIVAVEDAFRAYGEGSSRLGPIVLTKIDKHEGEQEIKSGYVENYGIGAKILTYYENNRSRYGLPLLQGIIVLNDITNGKPIAVMDGSYITASRTGAAGAIAAKYLARKDSKNIAVMGAGMQGRYQIAALSEILKISKVKVFDINAQSARNYVSEMKGKFEFEVESANSPQQAIADADLLVTATPSTKPYVLSEWIRDGVHINAIGADTPGKQELDASIIPRAKVVVDNISQCVERGEIQTAIRQGLLKKEGIYAELSDLVLGRRQGRASEKEITLFDATGMAVQDITTAYTVYNLAVKQGVGTTVELA